MLVVLYHSFINVLFFNFFFISFIFITLIEISNYKLIFYKFHSLFHFGPIRLFKNVVFRRNEKGQENFFNDIIHGDIIALIVRENQYDYMQIRIRRVKFYWNHSVVYSTVFYKMSFIIRKLRNKRWFIAIRFDKIDGDFYSHIHITQ